MNTLTTPVMEQATIEGFPLSPVQSRALQEYADGKNGTSQVVLHWSTPVDIGKVTEFLRSRIQTQPIFSTRIYPIEDESGGLQVLKAGVVSHITVADRAAFDGALASRFPIEGAVVMRCIYLAEGNQLQRLALVAPPHVCDVDGLLGLVAAPAYEGELTFQHFSEWCAETAPDIKPVLQQPTPLDIGLSDAPRPVPLSLRLVGVRADGSAVDPYEAASVGAAVLLPCLQQGDDEHAVCLVSFDGRLFDNFALVAGPFRFAVPVRIERRAPSAQAFMDHLGREIDETLHRVPSRPCQALHGQPAC